MCQNFEMPSETRNALVTILTTSAKVVTVNGLRNTQTRWFERSIVLGSSMSSTDNISLPRTSFFHSIPIPPVVVTLSFAVDARFALLRNSRSFSTVLVGKLLLILSIGT